MYLFYSIGVPIALARTRARAHYALTREPMDSGNMGDPDHTGHTDHDITDHTGHTDQAITQVASEESSKPKNGPTQSRVELREENPTKTFQTTSSIFSGLHEP